MQEISNSLAFGRTLPLANRGLRTQRGLLSGVGATLSLLGQAVAAIRRNGGTLIGIPDNFAGTYTDSTGTTPVTAVGDLVGLLTDRSYGAGNLGVELFSRTLDFSDAGWTKTAGVTFAGVGTFTTNTAGGVICDATGASQSKTYAIRVVGSSSASLSIRNSSGLTGAYTIPAGSFDTTIRSNLFADSLRFYISSNSAGTVNITSISIREVLGNHATQPTTASKPVVTRVPKRLGPNLVVGGTFDADVSGWTASFGVATNSGGKLRVTSTGSASAPRAHQNFTTVPGTTYALSVDLTATTSQAVAYVGLSGGFVTSQIIPPITPTGTARAYGTFTATGTTTSAIMLASSTTSGNFAEFDNIEVREVLEWTNAISFDGSNDFLQTGITTGNEGWICAGVTFGAPLANNETVFSNGAGSATMKGVWLVRLAGGTGSSAVRLGVGNGTALTQVTGPFGLTVLGTPSVVEGGWTADSVMVGVDGQTTTAARAGDATPAQNTPLIGGYLSGFHHLAGPMTVFIYTPVLPSAADRALIRKWVGSLQGQTL